MKNYYAGTLLVENILITAVLTLLFISFIALLITGIDLFILYLLLIGLHELWLGPITAFYKSVIRLSRKRLKIFKCIIHNHMSRTLAFNKE